MNYCWILIIELVSREETALEPALVGIVRFWNFMLIGIG